MIVGKKDGKAHIPGIADIIKAGIDPSTGSPIKAGLSNPEKLKESVKLNLRIMDEQDHCCLGTWYNLPLDLSSEELERLLYYYGSLCFFYLEETDEFIVMPYALDGNLDKFNRFNYVHPVPFNGQNNEQAKALSQKKFKVVYKPKDIEEMLDNPDLQLTSCVILNDRIPQWSQNGAIIPMWQRMEGVIDHEAELVSFARTRLLTTTGVRGVRVEPGSEDGVAEANKVMYKYAIEGKPNIPIASNVEMQELSENGDGKVEEFYLALETIDNLRLSFHGIDNGGLFDKKSQTLQSEFDVNGGKVGMVLQDKINHRQRFCNIVNSIWGCGIWYEPSETITQLDYNGDGKTYDTDNDDGNSDIGGTGNGD